MTFTNYLSAPNWQLNNIPSNYYIMTSTAGPTVFTVPADFNIALNPTARIVPTFKYPQFNPVGGSADSATCGVYLRDPIASAFYEYNSYAITGLPTGSEFAALGTQTAWASGSPVTPYTLAPGLAFQCVFNELFAGPNYTVGQTITWKAISVTLTLNYLA